MRTGPPRARLHGRDCLDLVASLSGVEGLDWQRWTSMYTALRFPQRLADAGITASLGSTGDSYTNVMAESFFGTIKAELLYRQH